MRKRMLSKSRYKAILIVISISVFITKYIHLFHRKYIENSQRKQFLKNFQIQRADFESSKFYSNEDNDDGAHDHIKFHEEKLNLPIVNAILLVRLYEEDKMKWSKKELKEWIYYMSFAGISNLYFYDNYKPEFSKQENLKSFITEINNSQTTNDITKLPINIIYHDWSNHHPYTIESTQISAYKHAFDNYKFKSDWMVSLDMDEYVYSEVDKERNFLPRMIEQILEDHDLGEPDFPSSRVGEIALHNFIYSSFEMNQTDSKDKTKQPTWYIQNPFKRPKYKSNNLDKPIFRTKGTVLPRVHHQKLRIGYKTIHVNDKHLRTNHYWGDRLGKSREELERTDFVRDDGIFEIVGEIKKLL